MSSLPVKPIAGSLALILAIAAPWLLSGYDLNLLARFLALWLLMTAASSGLLAWTTDTLGLQMAWLAKPLVEGGLAVLNFFLLRHVVYR